MLKSHLYGRLLVLLALTVNQAGCSRSNQPAAVDGSPSTELGRDAHAQGKVDSMPEVATAGSQAARDPRALAEMLAADVGTVTRVSGVGQGPIVIALEERHNSRIGQLQHAVVLVRMREQHGLKDVVLEGYLKGDPELRADWYAKSIKGQTPAARAEIAVRFLERGDISGAEFMKLVYPELALISAETRENYFVEPPSGLPMIEYLKKIAQVSPEWAIEKSKPYQSIEAFQSMSGDEKAASAKELKEYAEKHNIAIDSGTATQMQQYITFFVKRMASNQTIADSLAEVSKRDPNSMTATNIGADHSQGLCLLLDAARRPYAVIGPRYVPEDKKRGDLSDEMYDRKNNGLPVYDSGLSKIVLGELPKETHTKKKPAPVLGERPFQAEAELHALTASLTESVLGSTKPPNDGRPPYGLSAGDFDGRHVRISLDESEYIKPDGGRPAGLLIAAVFKATGRRIFLGTTLQSGIEPQGNARTVETIVKDAITRVEAEREVPQRAEDATGALQIGLRVRALVGTDPQAVKRMMLNAN